MIAICGTGMGSLAGMLKKSGHHVTGSDQNIYPPMSTYLSNLGIEINEGYRAENIEGEPDLVVIGNAVRRDNPEARAAVERNLEYTSFPGALRKYFLSRKKTIAVCGTHGKTTTTALVSWIMTYAGYDPSFLVGGICKNFEAPIRLGEGRHFVIEGDEYDTAYFDKVPKFVRYEPNVAILANVEFDHADIYPDFDAVFGAFSALVKMMPEGALLAAGVDCPNVRKLLSKARCKVVTYGTDYPADIGAEDVGFEDGYMRFRICRKDKSTRLMRSPIIGRHNLKNILAAYSICKAMGVTDEDFAGGLLAFKGIKRRQEVRGIVGDIVVVDDFAHHPTAVDETLKALAMQWEKRRIVAVFEPRTNTSRRKYFQRKYAESFDQADEIVIAPVYDEKAIKPDQRFDTAKLAGDLREKGKKAFEAPGLDRILNYLADNLHSGDLVVLFSNGGFGGLHEKLLDQLREIYADHEK